MLCALASEGELLLGAWLGVSQAELLLLHQHSSLILSNLLLIRLEVTLIDLGRLPIHECLVHVSLVDFVLAHWQAQHLRWLDIAILKASKEILGADAVLDLSWLVVMAPDMLTSTREEDVWLYRKWLEYSRVLTYQSFRL